MLLVLQDGVVSRSTASRAPGTLACQQAATCTSLDSWLVKGIESVDGPGARPDMDACTVWAAVTHWDLPVSQCP